MYACMLQFVANGAVPSPFLIVTWSIAVKDPIHIQMKEHKKNALAVYSIWRIHLMLKKSAILVGVSMYTY